MPIQGHAKCLPRPRFDPSRLTTRFPPHLEDAPLPSAEDAEDPEDRFLRMLSTEVGYKQLLNQSPYAVTDIEWSVLVQRLLDNLEDDTQRSNGKFEGRAVLRRRSTPKEGRRTVAVLGVRARRERSVEVSRRRRAGGVRVRDVSAGKGGASGAGRRRRRRRGRADTRPGRSTRCRNSVFDHGRCLDVCHRRLNLGGLCRHQSTGCVIIGLLSAITTGGTTWTGLLFPATQ